MTTPRTDRPTPLARRAATLAAAVLIGLAGLAGCTGGGDGASTDCGLDACTVTFDRGVNAEASVLGVDARLVGADGDKVTVEVAGEQLTLTVDEPATEVAGLYVSLDRATESQLTVRIGRNAGS